MTDKPKPLRILCLHGYRQSEKIFRQKTGSLRKILKNKAELVYMTAPNMVPAKENERNDADTCDNDPQHGWWFSKSDNSYRAVDYTDCCIGFEESLDTVAEFMKKEGPFDGILAFSQGACFLSLVCSLKEKGDQRFQFKFAVFIAGFISRQSQHAPMYDCVFTIPSLHVIGETDKIIDREMSDKLLEKFQNAVVLRHPGGHFVPASAPQKSAYIEFLKQFQSC